MKRRNKKALLKFKICYKTAKTLLTFQSLADSQTAKTKEFKYPLSILIHNLSANDGYTLWPLKAKSKDSWSELIENLTWNCDAYKSEKVSKTVSTGEKANQPSLRK